MNENTAESAILIERLSFCQREQTKVTLFIAGQQLTGVVIRLEPGFAELRCGEEKALVRLQNISAIFYK